MIQYDPGASFLLIALEWSGTVLPAVLRRVEFWVFFILHLVVMLLYRWGYLAAADDKTDQLYVSWNYLKIISGMTTFFEVFYANQCFTRFLKLYNEMRGILSCFDSFVYQMKLWLGSKSMAHIRLSSRFFLCSNILFMFEAEKPCTEREWEELIDHGLLKPDERECLEALKRGQRATMLLFWSGEVMVAGCEASKVPGNVMMEMMQTLLYARRAQQIVMDSMAAPLPYQYFHLLNVMILVNLVLWAYGMGVTESWAGPLVYFFSELIFMGLMELAGQFSDPFGTDATDFPLNAWVSEAAVQASILLEHLTPELLRDWKRVLDGAEAPKKLNRQLSINVDLEEKSANPSDAVQGFLRAFSRTFSPSSNNEEAKGDTTGYSELQTSELLQTQPQVSSRPVNLPIPTSTDVQSVRRSPRDMRRSPRDNRVNTRVKRPYHQEYRELTGSSPL
eukprot:gnl/TRDRNA2_/TRDRNA2_151623_c0_seq1.p1 gnl/TRDRNA2_/TRDRNA2_151623_c0~~gnl/TRDRNA2_/TRDRNA2_151623_c0_seq1.p1  ORF type:complete len:448 (-),score=50.93 gnl/TRDRNA2_/TRDRNA2_151623_c0_seq1:148-1491(-)